MTNPYEEFLPSPKVNYKSLEYRLYHLATACIRYLDENDPRQAKLKKLCNDLPAEYERRVMQNHNERN
jgi:hypothetical protein